ncbi:hypothetical protein RHGRI_010042 [Rhododendron griersonianum]|uniref:Uncharacterized protein n=1 Tax=Rhododendron griersonianum TaxID=479676 RepID=A0AAV6KH00_9ERIC|nr:hypothetical protein RHGRI_010042 [Rhododendron griersonianum]
MPSLSAVEVKVQEPYLTVSHPCSPDGLMSHEVCVSFERKKKNYICVNVLESDRFMVYSVLLAVFSFGNLLCVLCLGLCKLVRSEFCC